MLDFPVPGVKPQPITAQAARTGYDEATSISARRRQSGPPVPRYDSSTVYRLPSTVYRQEHATMQRHLARLGWLGGIGDLAARLAAVGLLLALAVTAARPIPAAGQEDDTEPDAAAEGEVTEPLGTFTVAITEDDLPPALAGGPGLIGVWNITFNEDGTYQVARQDVGVLVTGTYEVDGDTLTVSDDSGLLSCGNDLAGDAAEASYAWEVSEGELSLTPIEDDCAGRRIIFTTRNLGGYAPCETEPFAGLERDRPSPDGEEGNGDEDAPPADLSDIFADQTPAADEDAPERPASAATESAIDALLAQATSCWITGDPARFLPLHSQEAIEELALLGEGAGGLQAVAEFIGQLMTTPISFERIGAVQQLDRTHVRARMAIGSGGDDGFFQPQVFVLEDGEWLFDTFFFLTEPEDSN